MKDGFYRQTARVERDHWWFRYRRRLVATILEQSGFEAAPGARALDIGCGTGGNLDALRSLGLFAVGLDRSPLALELARRGAGEAALVRADANGLDRIFVPCCFDLISCFNVLYHRWIADDREVVGRAAGLLRPGGWFVLTEPAHRFLRRAHDRVDYGARRYRVAELRAMVVESGLEVVRSTAFNAAAFFPALAAAALDRIVRSPDAEQGDETAELAMPVRPLGSLIRVLCATELMLIRRFGRVPLGVTYLIVGRRASVRTDQVGM